MVLSAMKWHRAMYTSGKAVENYTYLRFGMFHTWTNVRRTFKGLIDDFRVYKKAFSSSEVQALFGNGNGDGVNTPAPVHFTITGSESPDNFTAVGLPTGLSVNAEQVKLRVSPRMWVSIMSPSRRAISLVQPSADPEDQC